jgi:HlyD family secretion protein
MKRKMDIRKIMPDSKRIGLWAARLRNLNKRQWIWIILAAVVLFIGAVKLIPKAVRIALSEVRKGEFIVDIRTRGEIDALRSTTVSVPPMRRRMMLQIVDMIPEGSIVKKGDFLFQLDKSQAQQTVDDAKDQLENARANLSTKKAQIQSEMAQLESDLESQRYSMEQAKLNLKSMEYEAEIKKREQELVLKKAEVALAQAAEKIKSQKIVDRATLMEAELAVKQAKTTLDDAQDALSALSVMSPLDGLVVYQEIFSSGSLKKVQVGDSPFWGQPVIKIPDLSQMMVKTTVNEVQISQLDLGQNAVVTVDALEGKNYFGHVSRVASLARRELTTNIKVFDVEVQIDSTDGLLRPGMTCDCQIVTGRIKEAMFVPVQAVFQKQDTTVVYTMLAGRPKMRKVKIGAKGSNFVVVEKGLQGGEKVCMRDPTVPLESIGGQTETAASAQPAVSTQQPQQRSGNPMMFRP